MKRLNQLALESKKSFNQIEKELGYPRNALAPYRTGKRIPSHKRLIELADYFGVNLDYLLETSEKDEDYYFNQTIQAFNNLNLKDQLKLLNYIQLQVNK